MASRKQGHQADSLHQRWCKLCQHPNYFASQEEIPDACRLCGKALTAEPRAPGGAHYPDARQRYIRYQRERAKESGMTWSRFNQDKEAFLAEEVRKAKRLARRREMAERLAKQRKEAQDDGQKD